jgi:DNA polymerase-3 subunit delta
MKVAPRNTESFLRAPPENIRIVLIFGRDQGLVHERVLQAAKTIVPDLSDPFLVSNLTGGELKADPPKLSDEASSQSLVGGRRVVMVQLGGEDVSPALNLVLEGPKIDSLVVVEGGDLVTPSPVRKLLEGADEAAVIACYEDNQSSLGRLIDSVAQDYQIKVDRSAHQYLLSHLGNDRLVSRRELEKLMLYAGAKNDVSLEDAVAVVGDSGALSLEELIYAAAGGEREKLDDGFARAAAEGVSPIAIIRAAQRHIAKLQLATAAFESGKSPDESLKTVKPPVIFLYADRFKRQLTGWSSSRLASAASVLIDAETDCKTTGMPDQAICERALMSLAQVARHQMQR